MLAVELKFLVVPILCNFFLLLCCFLWKEMNAQIFYHWMWRKVEGMWFSSFSSSNLWFSQKENLNNNRAVLFSPNGCFFSIFLVSSQFLWHFCFFFESICLFIYFWHKLLSFMLTQILWTMQGDHVTYLSVYKGFIQSGKSSQWCYKNFINYHAMVSIHVLNALNNLRNEYFYL